MVRFQLVHMTVNDALDLRVRHLHFLREGFYGNSVNQPPAHDPPITLTVDPLINQQADLRVGQAREVIPQMYYPFYSL